MTQTIEQRTAEFLATLDPLFAEIPVYPILLTDDVPAYFHPGPNCEGWTSPFADLIARPLLEETGRWRGRGFTFFMLPPPGMDATNREWLGKCIHEAGHYLAAHEAQCEFVLERMPPDIQNAFAPYATVDGFVDRLKESGKPVCGDTDDELARRQHCPNWIRATLHLVERANATASIFTACATSHYGRLPGWLLAIALADEIRELRDAPIREILKTALPARFVEFLERPG